MYADMAASNSNEAVDAQAKKSLSDAATALASASLDMSKKGPNRVSHRGERGAEARILGIRNVTRSDMTRCFYLVPLMSSRAALFTVPWVPALFCWNCTSADTHTPGFPRPGMGEEISVL